MLLGGFRDRVPPYASGSLRRGLTNAQAQRAAQILVQKGFKEMKTQMALPGDPTPAEECRRIRVVREAIDIGSRIEDVGLFWLEDVTTADDYQGLAPGDRRAENPHRRRGVSVRHRAVPANDIGHACSRSTGRAGGNRAAGYRQHRPAALKPHEAAGSLPSHRLLFHYDNTVPRVSRPPEQQNSML